jgi:AcrR family transcriptional regulator
MNPEGAGSNGPGEAREAEPPLDLHRWKLPRGRHGLPREVVAQSQRERLLAAVVRVTAAKGYQATSVADILEAAGVGRESFYKHFKDKEDCFVAAFDMLVDEFEGRVGDAYEQPGPWAQRVRLGLSVALEWLAAEPDVAREMGTVGPIAIDRFWSTFHRFAAILDEGAETGEHASSLPNIASIAGGAVFACVYEELVLGNASELGRLAPLLTFELLLPYIGEDAARKEQEAAAKAIGA